MGERGESTLITIVAVLIAAILLTVVPTLIASNANDNIAQQKVQTAVSELLHDISTTGSIDMERFDAFIQEIQATGNTYEIDIEHQILDLNPSIKVTQVESTKIGENLYWTKYYNEKSLFEELLNNSNLRKALKEGDIITIKVKNTNRTLAQTISDTFTGVGLSDVKVYASGSEVVITNGTK